jgi:hypothetical protein
MADYGVQLDNYTVKQKALAERTANNTLAAYTRRALSKQDAMSFLFQTGYSELEARALLESSDLEYTLARKKTIVEELTTQYIEYTIDDVELTSMLTLFEFAQLEIERLLDELNTARMLRGKKPSLSEIRKGFSTGLISASEFVREIKGLGYPNKYVVLLLANSGFTDFDSLEGEFNGTLSP